MIAVDIPHPHAVFFGVDNFRVGFEAGQLLGALRPAELGGKPSWVLPDRSGRSGPIVQIHYRAFEGVRSHIPDIPIESFVRMDGRGMRDKSYHLVSTFYAVIPETAPS